MGSQDERTRESGLLRALGEQAGPFEPLLRQGFVGAFLLLLIGAILICALAGAIIGLPTLRGVVRCPCGRRLVAYRARMMALCWQGWTMEHVPGK